MNSVLEHTDSPAWYEACDRLMRDDFTVLLEDLRHAFPTAGMPELAVIHNAILERVYKKFKA